MKTLNKYFSIGILFVFLSINTATFAQVGIGTGAPNANAMLDIDVSSLGIKKGFMPPRMTTTEKNTLGTSLGLTDKGMLVFDTTLTIYYYWNGAAWIALVATGGGYVDLTTDQTIAGMKTFTGDLTPAGRLMLPMGEISYANYAIGHAVAITTPTIGDSNTNMVKINPPSVNFINDGLNSGYSNGSHSIANTRLTYTGAVARYFHIALSFSFTPGDSNDTYVFGVAKGSGAGASSVVPSSKLFNKAGATTDYQSSAMHVLLKLEPNDYVEFFVGEFIGTGNIILRSINFVAIGM